MGSSLGLSRERDLVDSVLSAHRGCEGVVGCCSVATLLGGWLRSFQIVRKSSSSTALGFLISDCAFIFISVDLQLSPKTWSVCSSGSLSVS